MKIKFSDYCGRPCETEVTKEWLDDLRKHYEEPEIKELFYSNGIKSFQQYVRVVLSFNSR